VQNHALEAGNGQLCPTIKQVRRHWCSQEPENQKRKPQVHEPIPVDLRFCVVFEAFPDPIDDQQQC
jgi:hypothetical protein